MRSMTKRVAAGVTAAALLGAAGGAGTYATLASEGAAAVPATVAASSQTAAAETAALSVGEIYALASKGVVEITTESSGGNSQFPFDGQGAQQAQGSGFVLDERGHVITNHHVVDGADSVSVTFWNGATYDAKVIGSDASTDVAVLEVDAPASLLSPLTLGDSSSLAVGDGVVAIGSPFGLEETVTSGIVSALEREITAPNGFAIADAIQTDAAINHGNSGGPLLNSLGRVVGINSQIESESEGNDGIGFAVPSNTVRSIAAQLIESGSVEHAYLGIAVETVPSAVATELGGAAGAAVTDVASGTPAAKAGLKAASETTTVDGKSYPTGGDVITKIDGTVIGSAAALRSLIDARQPGEEVRLRVVRGVTTRTVTVTLTSRPSSAGSE